MKFSKVSVFVSSSFQNADRIENVDGSPLPLLEIKAIVVNDVQLQELKREIAHDIWEQMKNNLSVSMDSFIHNLYPNFEIKP
jgi:hypothetical protein